MNRYRFLSGVLLAGVLIGRPGFASADTITASLSSAYPPPVGQFVTVDLSNPGGPAIDSSVFAGELDWQRTSTNVGGDNTYSGPPNLGQSFISFCVDLTQDVVVGNTYTYNVVSLASTPSPNGGTNPIPAGGMGTAKANEIDELWGRFYSSIGTNSTNAAAFQIAIWQIEYGSSTTLNSGNISFSGNTAATAQASTWLGDLTGNTSYYADLAGLDCPTAQDQVIAVPTPASVWMGLLMVGLIGGVSLARRGNLLGSQSALAASRG